MPLCVCVCLSVIVSVCLSVSLSACLCRIIYLSLSFCHSLSFSLFLSFILPLLCCLFVSPLLFFPAARVLFLLSLCLAFARPSLSPPPPLCACPADEAELGPVLHVAADDHDMMLQLAERTVDHRVTERSNQALQQAGIKAHAAGLPRVASPHIERLPSLQVRLLGGAFTPLPPRPYRNVGNVLLCRSLAQTLPPTTPSNVSRCLAAHF